jgi:acetyl esterase/lipase
MSRIIQECDPELRDPLKGMEDWDLADNTKRRTYREEGDALSVLEEYDVQYTSKLQHFELIVQQNGYSIILSVFYPLVEAPSGGRPCVYYIHGGGLVVGNRFAGMRIIFPIIHDLNAVCVTVEYRLAPEYPAPAALEDCYHGMLEVWKQRKSLGINPGKLLIFGRSAGGCLAAGLTLWIRDSDSEAKPQICGQVLSFPMLDNKSDTESCRLFQDSPAWSLRNNSLAWQYYAQEQVTIYTAPGTAGIEQLSNLPPTLLEIGCADILYTEGHTFGEKLMKSGTQIAVKEWKAYHCFDGGPGKETRIGRAIRECRLKWLQAVWSNSGLYPNT